MKNPVITTDELNPARPIKSDNMQAFSNNVDIIADVHSRYGKTHQIGMYEGNDFGVHGALNINQNTLMGDGKHFHFLLTKRDDIEEKYCNTCMCETNQMPEKPEEKDDLSCLSWICGICETTSVGLSEPGKTPEVESCENE